MDNSFLRPPNGEFLSDAPIYCATESKRPSRSIAGSVVSDGRSTHHSTQLEQRSLYSEHTLSQEFARTHLEDTNTGANEDSETKAVTLEQPLSMSGDQQQIYRRDYPVQESTADLPPREKTHAVTIQLIISEKERIRALRRERQIRYRKKKYGYMLSLEAETKALQEEIKNLKQRRRSFSAVVPTQRDIWNVSVEYFRLFRHGLQASVTASSQSSVQVTFLRATMAPDIIFNSDQGIDAMIQRWKWISRRFQDFEVELEGLDKNLDGSLVAVTTTRITISEQTLHNVFPHMCSSDDEEDLGQIVGQLLGRRFSMRGLTRIEWDAAYRRVSCLTAQSDMLTPMLRLLGSLEEASRVFEKALISPAFRWRNPDAA